MISFLAKRIMQAVAVVLATASMVFFAVFIIGDPAQLLYSQNASAAEVEAARRYLGLDLPLYQQYFNFMGGLLHGDLGRSFVYGKPALGVILQRLPATLELAFASVVLAVVVGLPLGLYCGLNPRTIRSRLIMAVSALGVSLPTFWIGIIIMLAFAVNLRLLPTGGRGNTLTVLGVPWSFLTIDGLRHLLLPAASLALWQASLILRLTRAGTEEVLRQDYVRFARAKGIAPGRILWVHVLKNVLAPVVTMVGLSLGGTIAFSIVTESIFSWPGAGKLLIDSIYAFDRPIVVAYLMLAVTIFVLINTFVDLIYAAIDPRVTLGAADSGS
ncbi:ABC transporter permease [Chelatococcus asaccharovorans]|uniref:Peptide/nickel transport system permease protein n=1 Tax=Chelatococcus asaccharovorans TaxID=28210 RepID=A0A2V3UGC5_9HYPH|nr:ABC transporter permease [Chelatococcus asaccharovorans]MBS7703738.1 ABC transporter permease [Chelatococcus asaccharovorans]PXW57896.1 peptide/nickel transport system permease protein [Chelatococcus asaccharovorans]